MTTTLPEAMATVREKLEALRNCCDCGGGNQIGAHWSSCVRAYAMNALSALRSAAPLAETPEAVERVAHDLERGERIKCGACGRMKKPRGRSAAMEAASGYCDDESCGGYGVKPLVGDLWPGESRIDFGFPTELVDFRRKQARAALRVLDALLASPGETPPGPTVKP